MAVSNCCLFTWLFLWGICVLGDASGDATTPPHLQCSIISQTRVKCSHLQLTSVPQSLPNTLEVFDLSYNNLTVLHNASFTEYNLIKVLNISHNFIQVLESGTFGNLPGLETLMLESNVITEIPSTVFVNNTFISTLILSNNKLRRIPHLHGLCSNKKLHGNTTVSKWRNIATIDFSHNNLTLIEKEDFAPFHNCSISKFLFNKNNNLTTFSENVFSLFSNVDTIYANSINLTNFTVSSFLGSKRIRVISLVTSKINFINPLNKSSHIPKEQFPEIDILKLTSNKLSAIPDYALFGFQNLQILDLGSNRIYAISNKSFCELSSLLVLNLSNNKMKYLPHGAFACLANLEYINIALNKYMRTLDPGSFAGSSSLQHLNLYNGNVEFIRKGSWNTTSLQKIDLSYNELTHLRKSMFMGLYQLRSLKLTGNRRLNKIYRDTFHDMKALENLTIAHLKTFNINSSLVDVESLIFLDCSHLKLNLTSIHQFTNMSSLLKLYMTQTKIHAGDMVNKKTKESLFSGLKSLRTLKLNANDLVYLNNVPWIFSPLVNLQFLDLTYCRLEVISTQIFENLTSLRELKLQQNRIVNIFELAFQHLYSLQDLLLQYNKIKVIEKNLFKGTTNLKRLYLQGNQISTIAPNTIIPPHLYRLNIADNPFTCTCQLVWFTHWLHTTNAYLEPLNKTLCSSTSFMALVNQPVLSFHPEEYCNNVVLILGVTIAILAVVFLCILVYYKRWWFNHKIFLLKLAVCGYIEIIEDVDPSDYEYQLNLMFHEDDKEWVDNYMKPALEERMPHLGRVAFGDDDLNLGMYYLNALYDNIENSFKTALLISNQSVDDTWFMTKLRMAVEHVNDTKLDKIILIFLEDIQEANLPYLVRLLLSRNKPYLLVTNDEDGQDLFWAQFEKEMRANRAINSVIPT